MFFEPVRIRRPDLRREVSALITLLQSPAGSGVPLTELVRVMGISISAGFQGQIAARGALHLSHERFHNDGPAIRRPVRLLGTEVQLHIAESLSGSLERRPEGPRLRFEPHNSVSISKLLFRTWLRQLDLSEEQVRVDFAGAQDLLIDLK